LGEGELNAPGAGPGIEHDVKPEVLHCRVEVLLHCRIEPVDLVDEEDVPLLKIRENSR
jgi:hypothetical protein